MSQYESLLKEAKELNIPTQSGIYKPKHEAWTPIEITEYELQRRINEEKRHIREHKIYKLAFASSIASIFSAFAAVIAVFYNYI